LPLTVDVNVLGYLYDRLPFLTSLPWCKQPQITLCSQL